MIASWSMAIVFNEDCVLCWAGVGSCCGHHCGICRSKIVLSDVTLVMLHWCPYWTDYHSRSTSLRPQAWRRPAWATSQLSAVPSFPPPFIATQALIYSFSTSVQMKERSQGEDYWDAPMFWWSCHIGEGKEETALKSYVYCALQIPMFWLSCYRWLLVSTIKGKEDMAWDESTVCVPQIPMRSVDDVIGSWWLTRMKLPRRWVSSSWSLCLTTGLCVIIGLKKTASIELFIWNVLNRNDFITKCNN